MGGRSISSCERSLGRRMRFSGGSAICHMRGIGRLASRGSWMPRCRPCCSSSSRRWRRGSVVSSAAASSRNEQDAFVCTQSSFGHARPTSSSRTNSRHTTRSTYVVCKSVQTTAPTCGLRSMTNPGRRPRRSHVAWAALTRRRALLRSTGVLRGRRPKALDAQPDHCPCESGYSTVMGLDAGCLRAEGAARALPSAY
jgi:hypothetical protein